MARGNCIVLESNPKGKFEEGTISGTPKVGTCMKMTNADPIGGRFTWVAETGTPGEAVGLQSPVCVLREDDLQGFTVGTAYVSGKRGFLYFPLPGEELNLLLRYESGTGTVGEVNIGDRLSMDPDTGMLIPYEQSPQATNISGPSFTLMEHITTALTADYLAWVRFNG